MKETAAASHCPDNMKILSDVARLWLLEEVLAGSKQANKLSALIKIDQSLLANHLKVLREAGVAKTARDGKGALYEITAGAQLQDAEKPLTLGCCQSSLVALHKRH